MNADQRDTCRRCGAKRRGTRIWHDKSCPERHVAALGDGVDVPTEVDE